MPFMQYTPLIPAKAGIQLFGDMLFSPWVPAFAGTSGFFQRT
jgi:hypothetical protein